MYKLLVLLLLVSSVNLSEVSFYEVLGVSKQATTQEIRQAYKKLAIKLHPDKNPDFKVQEKFLKITEAYETLKDAEKRQKYDLYGSYPTYSRKYDYHSQAEYDNLYYNGLYHDDPFVDTLSGGSFYNYLTEGFHFINFYSPFCPPCQNVADHWKKLAEVYKGVVKIGAVNCKYHNSFCYNSMRIGSYPSLLFYPNGKNGNFIYYRGERTFEALDSYLMTYLRSQAHVPTVASVKSTDKPMAYVLGENRIHRDALTRIAYKLNGLVTVVIVDDDDVRAKLSRNDYTTVVYKYKSTTKEITSTEEKEVLAELVESLPKIDLIDPDKLKTIRNKLRAGSKKPWVIFFSSKGDDRLELHQMKVAHPDMKFGEIKCEEWGELCASLHVVATPAWGVVKTGGAYQACAQPALRRAVRALSLHSLSASDLLRILDGDVGIWVLLVVPHQLSWDHLDEPFTKASMHFNDDEEVNFGIMVCTASNDKYCRQVARGRPTILVQRADTRHEFQGEPGESEIVEFVHAVSDSVELQLSEQQVLEAVSGRRTDVLLLAFLPARCGRECDQLSLQWTHVARKLHPLKFVRVGMLNCAGSSGGFCSNIHTPTARLYPMDTRNHYSVNLQHLAQSPYMLEWALQYIDDSVQTFNWHSFTKTVISEELNPSSGVKPWLVYFHSPRCYRCYEMFSDFAVAGILLNKAVQLGKVNCLSDRGLCQHEQITSYPSLKLYLNRNAQNRFSSVVNIQVRDYESVMQEIKSHLAKYDADLLAEIDGVRTEGFRIKHDEF